MKALAGFVVGGFIGMACGLVYAASQERGTYDLSVLFYLPAGALVGALIGTGVGANL